MTPPHWVLTLEDYAAWIPRRIEESGCINVTPEPLVNRDLPLRQTDDGSVETGIDVPTHTLIFFDGLVLAFHFTLYEVRVRDELQDLELETYSFGLRMEDGTWIWRYDRHHGLHEGLDTHVHEGPNETRKPAPYMDLEDVLSLIDQEREDGRYERLQGRG